MSRRALKRLATGLLAGLCLAAAWSPGPVRAADTRIGYIDSARIFQEYESAKEAQARFERQVTGWREEAAEKQKAVETLRAEVRDQSPILSAARRQEKEEALQRAIGEYERYIQEVWGPQGRASQENERATAEVVGLIRAAVEKVAGEKGFDFVFDAASGFIIYANKTLDLTNDVLQELQSRSSTPR